jgi:parvulin-like peptidyl-prolyl isomerase
LEAISLATNKSKGHTADEHAGSHVKHHEGSKRVGHKQFGQYIFGAVVFVVLVAVVAVLIYFISKSGQSNLSGKDEVVALVNGEPITLSHLEEQYAYVPDMYKSFITKSILLNQTINERILLQEAEKAGIKVSQEDVQQAIDAAMEQAGITEDVLDERLAEQNITREYLNALYLKQLVINKFLEQTLFSRIKVSDSEVEKFYEENIHAMHILVESEEAASTIITELKKTSTRNIEEKFSELARKRSTDPSAQSNSGDLGEFSRGQMVKPFEEAAFALGEYEFTLNPVQTQFGYHVILRLPKEKTLEEQAEFIKGQLVEQKKAKAVPLYVDKLREEADVQIFYEEPKE